MNIEFLAVIVGTGVAIILLAVLTELIALRSSVNRSTAAVKDLMTDALEQEAAAHSPVTSAAGADASGPGQPMASSSAPDILPTVQQASAIAAASASQLSLAFPAAEQAQVQAPSAQARATNPPAGPQPKSVHDETAAPARPVRPADLKPKPSSPPAAPTAAVRPAAMAGGRKVRPPVLPRRPNETDEEYATRRARWQHRLKLLQQTTGKAAPQAALCQRPNETDEQFAARQERIRNRLEQKKARDGTPEQ